MSMFGILEGVLNPASCKWAGPLQSSPSGFLLQEFFLGPLRPLCSASPQDDGEGSSFDVTLLRRTHGGVIPVHTEILVRAGMSSEIG